VPGLQKYNNITLKWGVADDHSLLKWKITSIDGKTQRRNGSIILMDEKGVEKLRWNFVQGWAMKWTGPSFQRRG
jgi:phage tail-like protein